MSGTTEVQHIARWDGRGWQPVGGGLSGIVQISAEEPVGALCVFGGELVAGGEFTLAGGSLANHVASWNGSVWHPLGAGITGDYVAVRALLVADGNLIAGGHFGQAGDSSAANVARWDGVAWHPMGAGFLAGSVYALKNYGGSIVAGGIGLFTGSTSGPVARWNGTAWEELGFDEFSDARVRALAVFGTDLVAGGEFNTAGGTAASCVARWDGATWKPLGAGVTGGGGPSVYALSIQNGALVAGGHFERAGDAPAANLASWDGASWAPLGSGVFDPDWASIRALCVHDGMLVVGGDLSRAGDTPASNVAHWNGSRWMQMGAPGLGFDGPVLASTFYGGDLVVGGMFTQAGDKAVNGIARWNGSEWMPLGSGVQSAPQESDPPAAVVALALDGNDLVVGGRFGTAGGLPASNVARWNGASWSQMGLGLDDDVSALHVFEGEVVAGGSFTHSGTTIVGLVARWNGSMWQPLGNGVYGGVGFDPPYVADMTVFRDELVVAGFFRSAADTLQASIARWDGERWAPLGRGVRRGSFDDATVSGLVVWDNALIVGGNFDTASGIPTGPVARWDGTGWSAFSSGPWSGPNAYELPAVWAFAVSGNKLVASGAFDVAGGVLASNIARWDGSKWEPLGSGLNNSAFDLLADGERVWAGGWFTSAGGHQSAHIALWEGDRTPVAVQDLSGQWRMTSVHLTWRLNVSGRDVESVRVQRALESAGPYEDCAPLPLVPEASMSFDDTSSEPNRTWWFRLLLRSHAGAETVAGPIEVAASNPDALAGPLLAAFPAAGGPITIRYRIVTACQDVHLSIYDTGGRCVRAFDAGPRAPGDWSLAWDRCDAAGKRVARGIYFVQLKAGAQHAAVRIPLVRP